MFCGYLEDIAILYYRATKEIYSNLVAGKQYYCEPLDPDVMEVFMLDHEIRRKVFLHDPKEVADLKTDDFGMIMGHEGVDYINYIMKGDKGELLLFHCHPKTCTSITSHSKKMYEKIGKFREANGGAKAEDKFFIIVFADSDAENVETYSDIQQYRMNLFCVEEKAVVAASSSSSSSSIRPKRAAAEDAKVAIANQAKKRRSG